MCNIIGHRSSHDACVISFIAAWRPCVLVILLVLQCFGGSHGMKCIKSDLCTCQTDRIDVTGIGNSIL